MGPVASRGVPRAPRYSGTPGLAFSTVTGLSPSLVNYSELLTVDLAHRIGALNPGTNPGLGYVRFRSPLLTQSMSLSIPAGTEMFQFPAFALPALCVQAGVTEGCSAGFPHSDISGSKSVADSPKLFAGYHVFRRLSMPRHPPYTLSSLTTFIDHRHVESQCPLSTVLGELTFARSKAVFLIHLTGRVKRFHIHVLMWLV